MNKRFGFANEAGTSEEYGIRFLSYPAFDFGTEKIESIEVPGRVGTLTRRTGEYSDTTIENEIEFKVSSKGEYEQTLSLIRRWLMETKKIIYSDMDKYYFRAKKVSISDIKRKYGIYGILTVVFTCDPIMYLIEGDSEILIADTLTLINNYNKSRPIYTISGEGICEITVNGKIVTANVGQNITIDTTLMQTYREDGTLNNMSITGDYEDLHLQEGENIISVTSGFELKIIPKWGICL